MIRTFFDTIFIFGFFFKLFIGDKTRKRLLEHRNRMGINSAALNFLKRELKDQTTRFGEDGERNSGSGGGGGGEKRMRLG